MPSGKRVSEVQVTVIKPNDGLIAFASLVVDGQLYLSSIGVHSKLDGSGYRITYPTKRVGQQSVQIYHPISQELGSEIEQSVLGKIKEVMSKVNGRHSNSFIC